ncbi:MAG: exodeoxyribonuclease VII small subunit [Anaerolineae bacterium]|nr:exodeoxyribonuclease VII small subunit [Anaerolineae bacterium]
MSKLSDSNECDWTFEDAFQELEAVVARLEAGGLTLEQSLETYEWARELMAWCQKRLDRAELRVQQLTESGELKAL